MQLFHYRQGNTERGPFSLDQILSMWRRGQISPQDSIRSMESNDWEPAIKWVRKAEAQNEGAYNIIHDEQAPVDVVAKHKSYPNRGLAIVLLLVAAGLCSYHWSWGLLPALLAALMMRPAFACGTCHATVTRKADWCSRCGSHLK